MTALAPDRTELTLLEERLRRARVRVDSASPGGPEYDAAMAALEELEARVIAVLRGPAEAALAHAGEQLAAS